MMSSPDAIKMLVQETLFQASKAKQEINGPKPGASEKEQLMEACRDFEEVLLNEILREAKLERSMVTGEGTASQFYGEMIRENLARSLADGGGMGLAETLYRQLSRDPQIAPEEQSMKVSSDSIKGQE